MVKNRHKEIILESIKALSRNFEDVFDIDFSHENEELVKIFAQLITVFKTSALNRLGKDLKKVERHSLDFEDAKDMFVIQGFLGLAINTLSEVLPMLRDLDANPSVFKSLNVTNIH